MSEHQRIVADPDYWARYSQDLFLKEVARSVFKHKLEEVQTFRHDFFSAIGHALDQNADVVFQDAWISPDHLVLGNFVLEGDSDLTDIL